MFLAIELDFSAGIFRKEDFVSRFDIQGDHLAVVLTLPSWGFSLALSGRIKPPLVLLFFFQPFYYDPIV
jgi:hypothetical protein